MWEYIRPETVAKYVRFNRDDDNWHYDAHNPDMYTKQTEGVAFLWNCLSENDIALLADEVGMGKTLQALSVVALLFHQKPDARVLIIAPRSVVAENWISEYHTFIAQHYIKEGNAGNIVCTEIGGDPIHPAHHCSNLEELSALYKKCWPHFFIIRTSSLSILVKESTVKEGDSNSENQINQKTKQEKAFEEAKKIREELYKAKSECIAGGDEILGSPFDLLIIDEAHYFRTKYGGSQKVGAAQAFFGADKLYEEDSVDNQIAWRPIANKTLLLTATPNHSSEKDIENIFSYFPHRLDLPSDKKKRSKEILNFAALRRFRRFEKKTKYHYRAEDTLPASFLDPKDITSEIFFALYQKRLARFSENEKKHFLHGYLEGFEAIPEESKADTVSDKKEKDNATSSDEDQTESGESGKSTDYRISEYDSAILKDLLKKFRKTHGNDKTPRHPKYDKLVGDVCEKTLNSTGEIEKAVVFVRRIPSTKEIARRINREYDAFFCFRLAAAYGIKIDDKISINENLRLINEEAKDHILNKTKDDDSDGISEADHADIEEEQKDFQRSLILDMFKIRKNTTQEEDVYPSLYNQIQAFRKKCVNRKSIFSLMFHPPADYKRKPYKFTAADIVEKDSDIDYEGSAFWVRKNSKDKNVIDARDSLLDGHWNIEKGPNNKTIGTGRRESLYNESLETILTTFFHAAEYKNELKTIEEQFNNRFTVIQLESLGRFLRQGLLNASGIIVDLFVYYVEVCSAFQDKNLNLMQVEIYQSFLLRLQEEMKNPNSLLYSLIRQSIELFQVIQTKEMSLHNEEDLLGTAYWRWNIFNNQSPAYGFSGDTKNESVLHAFNTPFYPNVLVATSVLQEGVNLHMFCNTVYHYGIAWAAGDNEQRIGRVDRFFGKAHRAIIGGKDGRVTSAYPYLAKTLDETQLANFVRKKYRAERLLDQCMLDDSSTEIQTDEFGDWQKHYLLLRDGKETDTLIEEQYYEDPYPAITKGEKLKQRKWKQDEYMKGISPRGRNTSISDVRKKISKYAEEIAEKNGEIASFYKTDKNEVRTICVIEQKLDYPESGEFEKERRSQPIFFRLIYQANVSGIDEGTVYLLSLVTPLATKMVYTKWNIEDVYNQCAKLQEHYPGVQLALDQSVPVDSHFYLSARIDLPVFLDEEGITYLSYEEVYCSYKALLHFSDELELYSSEKAGGQNLTLKDHIQKTKSDRISMEEIKPKGKGFSNSSTVIEEGLNSNWEKSNPVIGPYYTYKKEIQLRNKNYEGLFILNNKYPFVFFEYYGKKENIEVKMAYPGVNFQDRERKLLEKWIDFVVREENS